MPPWFVVTDRAFEEVLDAKLEEAAPPLQAAGEGRGTLGAAIEAILARADLEAARKAARIRALWDALRVPEALAREVVEAYRRLGEEPFVAIRSSGREEDSETATRAGEFETFLYVRGEAPLLEHLKRAWSGLWTERAIHNRSVMGSAAGRAGGGVIVQRIVASRVSGVLQTVNVAGGDLREMVINAGLGLGEGVVSGTVAADQIVVAKEADPGRGPLRFRYITADKRDQILFNRRTGLGTARSETLYHQRLRPALEYVELCELVRVAARLEEAYGHPLDIEFGIEGARLYVLQARPVATAMAALAETCDRYPLNGETRP